MIYVTFCNPVDPENRTTVRNVKAVGIEGFTVKGGSSWESVFPIAEIEWDGAAPLFVIHEPRARGGPPARRIVYQSVVMNESDQNTRLVVMLRGVVNPPEPGAADPEIGHSTRDVAIDAAGVMFGTNGRHTALFAGVESADGAVLFAARESGAREGNPPRRITYQTLTIRESGSA